MEIINHKDNFEASLKYLNTISTSLKKIRESYYQILNESNSHTFSFCKQKDNKLRKNELEYLNNLKEDSKS